MLTKYEKWTTDLFPLHSQPCDGIADFDIVQAYLLGKAEQDQQYPEGNQIARLNSTKI